MPSKALHASWLADSDENEIVFGDELLVCTIERFAESNTAVLNALAWAGVRLASCAVVAPLTAALANPSKEAVVIAFTVAVAILAI
jgi:hypothetical protein